MNKHNINLNFWQLAFISLCVFLIGMPALNELVAQEAVGNIFMEVDGIVSMEAENATKMHGWDMRYNMKNSSGATLIDAGGQLSFTIRFQQAGIYTIWALHAKSTEGFRSDQANDCIALLNGKELSVKGGSSCQGSHTNVIGLGTHRVNLGWQSRPKTECVPDRKKSVIFNIESPGSYEFKIISRSPGYILDKLVFVHENKEFIPIGIGPAETLFKQ